MDLPLRMQGGTTLVGLYLNELVTRLCPRDDPHPGIYAAYRQTLTRLVAGEPAGWTLRRFERDLLAELGYALALDVRADSGEALIPRPGTATSPKMDYGPRPPSFRRPCWGPICWPWPKTVRPMPMASCACAA